MTDTFYELYMMRGPSPGTIFTLKDKNMTIGRDPLSDILINDPEVSRQHALLVSAPSGEFRIQDLGSTNGTFVDKERLASSLVTLSLSNRITLGGEVTLIFRERSIIEQSESIDGDEVSQIGEEKLPESAVSGNESPGPEQQGSQAEGPKEIGVKKPAAAAEQPVREIGQEKPLTESQQQAAAAGAGDDIPGPGQNDAPTSEGLTPNLILGLVLLMLCCSASMLLFLVYSGGDSLLRQWGLVP